MVSDRADDLVAVVTREQELLELLLYRAEAHQRVLACEGTRWIAEVLHEVEDVITELQAVELARSLQVSGMHLPPEAAWQVVAAAYPQPVADRLRAVAAAAAEAFTAAGHAVRQLRREVDRVHGATAGAADADDELTILLIEEVQALLDRWRPPTLAAFLSDQAQRP